MSGSIKEQIEVLKISINLLEKRVAALENQVQEQPKERFVSEDSNGKHYGNNETIARPNCY